MRLEDLKRGMKCVSRYGITFVFDYLKDGTAFYIGNSDWGGEFYSELDSNDIIKVYDIKDYTGKYELIWEREETKEETKEMTLDEVIKELGYDIKIAKE